MDLWLVLGFLAAACVLVGVGLSFKASSQSKGGNSSDSLEQFSPEVLSEGALMQRKVQDLTTWDDAGTFLDELRGEPPSVVKHTVDSMIKRWVINQNDETAATRARFLQTRLEQLKLVKEGQQLMIDLEALVLEREKRLLSLQLENKRLAVQNQNVSLTEQLAAQKEQMQLQLEIAEIQHKINALNAKPAPKMSPAEERAQRHAESEVRLESLKKEKQRVLKIEDEDERIRKANAIDDEIQKEMIEWSRTLP